MSSSFSRNDSLAEEGENEFTPTQAIFPNLSPDEEERILEARLIELKRSKAMAQSSTSSAGGHEQKENDTIGKMEKKTQQKYEESKKFSIGQFSQLQNEQKTLLEKTSELEKQHQMLSHQIKTDSKSAVTKFTTIEEQQKKILEKFSTFENFIGILKDHFGNELLKAVQPELRPKIAEKFSIALPNCWDSNGCHSNLKILGNDCLMIHYLGNGNCSSSVFAKCAIPSSEFGIFYYEIKVEKIKNSLSIGLATKAMPSYGSVGQHLDSYAYESNGIFWVNGTAKKGKEKYTNGDVVGFGVNLITRRIIFTKNGLCLDTAHLFLSPSSSDLLLFPCVTLNDCGDKIEANFGPNFQFDPANAKVFPEFRVKSNFWDVNACHNDLAISGPNCTKIHYTEKEKNGFRTVFAKYSILHSALYPSSIFYYELNSKKTGPILFGIAVKHQTPLDEDISKRTGTYSPHFRFLSLLAFADPSILFVDGATVGCGVNFANNQVFFTRNGRQLATRNVLISSSHSADSLFPFVTLDHPNTKIVAHFGPHFLFDLSTLG